MSESSSQDGRGALGSVAALERSLAAQAEGQTRAAARLEAARTEAARILATASADAAQASTARRRDVLDAADRDAEAIRRETEAAAAQLRAHARASLGAALAAALALVLPAIDEGEA